jgi:hypothetical protein
MVDVHIYSLNLHRKVHTWSSLTKPVAYVSVLREDAFRGVNCYQVGNIHPSNIAMRNSHEYVLPTNGSKGKWGNDPAPAVTPPTHLP